MAEGATVDRAGLQALIDVLAERGWTVVGPRRRDGAIVLAPVTGVDDLPRGLGDEQAPGSYRVRERGDDTLFGFAATAQSAKPWLFPPDTLLWRGRRSAQGFTIEPSPGNSDARVALIGIRACDLAALGIHDTVLTRRGAVDTDYAARRAGTFLVAVTCATPAGTCFCDSMGCGPRPGPGADLVLTELPGTDRALLEPGTPAGAEVLGALPREDATDADRAAAEQVTAGAIAQMGRAVRTDDLRDLLRAGAESPRWAEVAERCLACGNCTAVCPTCFCTTVTDVSDLAGELDERHRIWDSCFSQEYSRLHGGAVRTSTASRYRQWATHKLSAWVDQFGMSGCVGCGRCLTWCPAGIDLTAEVAALREAETRSTP